MINKILNILIAGTLIIPTLFAQEAEIIFDGNFFREFNRRPVIQRDDYFESITNKIVIGRGKITEISPTQRYKKKHVVKIESSDSGAFGHKFIFFVFIENKDMNLLTVDSKFEFKGQFMGYTALSTRRTEYIIDVIIMDGSTIID
jgi:hypothetical protein